MAEDMEWETFADFAAKLAAELGLELDQSRMWTWCLFLVSYSGDGTGYSITRPRGDTKTTVNPLPPASTWSPPDDGKERTARISVSRGPHTVALEISRRLAPTYRADLRAIAAHNAKEAAQRAHRQGLAEQIAAMFLKTSRPSHCQSNYSTSIGVHGPEYTGGDLRFSGGAAEIEFYRFRVPAPVALKMLAVFADAVKTGTADAATPDDSPLGDPGDAGEAPPAPQ
jgi:hypothetical protein